MTNDTAAMWSAIAAGLSALAAFISAFVTLRTNQLSWRNTEAALVKERARIITELDECFIEIGGGTEAVSPELMRRLRQARQEASLIFSPDAVAYILELSRLAGDYARAEDRDLVTQQGKEFGYVAAMFRLNIERWTNPYQSRPSWISSLRNRYARWRTEVRSRKRFKVPRRRD